MVDFDKVLIASSNAAIGLNPQGGYVTSWKVKHPKTGKDVDVLYVGKTIKRTGIPILFPYFGDAPGLPKHGFGRDSVWNYKSISEQSGALTLHYEDLSDDAKRDYPHAFKARIDIDVSEERSFLYTLRVINTGTSDLPITPGLHPYWAISHDKKKQIQIQGITGFDATKIDWDTNPPDTVFDYQGKTTVVFPDRKISIEDISAKKTIRHIVVWSQKLGADDYNFVCVEPVCGYNNDLMNNPIIVPPGSEWGMKLKFSVSFS